MELVNVNKRNTHRYRDGWAHEDSWEYLGSIKVTPARQVEEGNGIDEGGVFVRYARIRRQDDFRLLQRGLEDTMSTSGCRHDYDCCGCASYRTTVRRVKPRLVMIHTRVGYNY